MAVYRGPRAKVERRFNDPIFGQGKALQKKSYPPGQHGRMRRKRSEYAMQLMEKQKAKYTYGLLERQFANLFHKAVKKKGVTGEILLQLLETRLDNTVYRLNIAPTRRAARQLVLHRHITVNDVVVNIPSYTLKPGDLVAVREKSKSLGVIKDHTTAPYRGYTWLEWDGKQMKGKLTALPLRGEIPEKINEQSIVELYSK
ncbi:MAG: 30S ribosomal protein S4 [Bacteroidota bacterium]